MKVALLAGLVSTLLLFALLAPLMVAGADAGTLVVPPEDIYRMDGGVPRASGAQILGEVVNPDGGIHKHCWHTSPLQHTLINHRDEHCCRCNAERCINLPAPQHCKGHGPRCASPSLRLRR